MKYTFRDLTGTHEVEVVPTGGGFIVRSGGREIDVRAVELGGGRLELALPGRTVTLHAAVDGETRWIAFKGRTYELRRETTSHSRRAGAADAGEGVLRAPMPGQVRSIEVAAGDAVQKGQTLLLLEAMKMEIRIQSPLDGTVAALPVAEGDQVEREQVLIEIE